MAMPQAVRQAIATMYVMFALGVVALSILTIDRDPGDEYSVTDLLIGWMSVVCFGAAALGLQRRQLWALAPAAGTLLLQAVHWQRNGVGKGLSVLVFLWIAYLLGCTESRRAYGEWRASGDVRHVG